jgi:hypothetical protein
MGIKEKLTKIRNNVKIALSASGESAIYKIFSIRKILFLSFFFCGLFIFSAPAKADEIIYSWGTSTSQMPDYTTKYYCQPFNSGSADTLDYIIVKTGTTRTFNPRIKIRNSNLSVYAPYQEIVNVSFTNNVDKTITLNSPITLAHNTNYYFCFGNISGGPISIKGSNMPVETYYFTGESDTQHTEAFHTYIKLYTIPVVPPPIYITSMDTMGGGVINTTILIFLILIEKFWPFILVLIVLIFLTLLAQRFITIGYSKKIK